MGLSGNGVLDRLLDSTEVSKIIGFSPLTVRRKAETGEIPAIPFGTDRRRIWRFSADRIAKWLEERESLNGVRYGAKKVVPIGDSGPHQA